jgi:hypothetical protein
MARVPQEHPSKSAAFVPPHAQAKQRWNEGKSTTLHIILYPAMQQIVV